jgi:hypothetical protein
MIPYMKQDHEAQQAAKRRSKEPQLKVPIPIPRAFPIDQLRPYMQAVSSSSRALTKTSLCATARPSTHPLEKLPSN